MAKGLKEVREVAVKSGADQHLDDLVREVRFGRHPDATRVVMDMAGVDSYSVFTLYEPWLEKRLDALEKTPVQVTRYTRYDRPPLLISAIC